MGVDTRDTERICDGEMPVTAETALILARVFGNSAEFWLDLQRRVDLWEAMNPPGNCERIERARPLKPAA